MTNIASVLKAEIARVARKEIRVETERLKKAAAHQRHAIADLRRQIAELDKTLKRARPATARLPASSETSAKAGAGPATTIVDDGTPRRFSATRLAAHRNRLGLSAADYGKLVGISGATIYNWEHGTSRPSPEQIKALALLKFASPTALRERLASLN